MRTTSALHLLAACGLLSLATSAGALAQMPDAILDAKNVDGLSRLRLNIDGGLLGGGVFDGDLNGSGIPAEGSGTRMVWYPRKAAFRAGSINGTQWDAANIGNYSVAMGENVRASGDNGVAMGFNTVAANVGSTALGMYSVATGAASVALGYNAHTNARQGSFVFADRSVVDDGISTTDEFFRAANNHTASWRTSCGFRIFTASNLSTGVAIGGAAVSNLGSPTCPSEQFGQSNTMIATSTGAYLSSSGTWTNASDVNRKRAFAPTNGEDVLARLRGMPVTTWSYKVDDSAIRHMGPTAQDFRAAFGLGADSVSIATVDADGVALAAAKALEARSQAQEARIAKLEAEIAALREARVSASEASSGPLAAGLPLVVGAALAAAGVASVLVRRRR